MSVAQKLEAFLNGKTYHFNDWNTMHFSKCIRRHALAQMRLKRLRISRLNRSDLCNHSRTTCHRSDY